jgi:hypothetical protein
LLFHHDPDRTDEDVAVIERTLRRGEEVAVEAAREGHTIWLGPNAPEMQE